MDQDLFQQLEAYVDGELTTEESSALLLSIADHPEAKEALRGLERLKALVKDSAGEPRAPAGLRAGILADLEELAATEGTNRGVEPDPRVPDWQPPTFARWGVAATFFLTAILALRLIWPESVAHAKVVDNLRAEFARVSEHGIEDTSSDRDLRERLEKFIARVTGPSSAAGLPRIDGAECYRVSDFTCEVNGRGLRLDFLCEETQHHLLCAFLFPKARSAASRRLAAEIEAGRPEGAAGYLCRCKTGADGKVYCLVKGDYLLFLVGVDPRGAFVERYGTIFGEL